MMQSLRGRLFVALTALLLLTGTSTGFLMFRWAYSEALEVQDAVLLEVGAVAAKNRLHTEPTTQRGVHREDRVVIQELPAPADTNPAGPVRGATVAVGPHNALVDARYVIVAAGCEPGGSVHVCMGEVVGACVCGDRGKQRTDAGPETIDGTLLSLRSNALSSANMAQSGF